jgi:hypothetical protein
MIITNYIYQYIKPRKTYLIFIKEIAEGTREEVIF